LNIRQWELIVCWFLWFWFFSVAQGNQWFPSLRNFNPDIAGWPFGEGELFFLQRAILTTAFALIVIKIKRCATTILLTITSCLFLLLYYFTWSEYPDNKGYFYAHYHFFRHTLNIVEMVIIVVGFPRYGLDNFAKRLWNRFSDFIALSGANSKASHRR